MSTFFKKSTSQQNLTFRTNFDRESANKILSEVDVKKLFNKDQVEENAIQPQSPQKRSR